MHNIPITFGYEGKIYTGHFNQVSGSGTNATFHLMIDNRYRGQLVKTERLGWHFSNNKDEFKGMGDTFGKHITQALNNKHEAE